MTAVNPNRIQEETKGKGPDEVVKAIQNFYHRKQEVSSPTKSHTYLSSV